MRSQYLTYEKKHTDERKQYVVVVVAAAATASPGMVGGRAGATDGVDGYPTPPAKKVFFPIFQLGTWSKVTILYCARVLASNCMPTLICKAPLFAKPKVF